MFYFLFLLLLTIMRNRILYLQFCQDLPLWNKKIAAVYMNVKLKYSTLTIFNLPLIIISFPASKAFLKNLSKTGIIIFCLFTVDTIKFGGTFSDCLIITKINMDACQLKVVGKSFWILFHYFLVVFNSQSTTQNMNLIFSHYSNNH